MRQEDHSSPKVHGLFGAGAFFILATTGGVSFAALLHAYDETVALALASICAVLISAELIYVVGWRVLVVTPAVLFLIYYFFFVYVGTFVNFLESPAEYLKTLRIVSVGILFFSVGVVLSNLCSHFSATTEYRKLRSLPLTDSRRTNIPLLVLFLGGLLLAFMYFYRAGGIPAFAELVEEARVEATAGGGYFLLGISAVLPFASLGLIGRAEARKTRKDVTVAIAAVLVTSTIMIFAALKDLVPFFLLWIVFFLQFCYGRLTKTLLLVPLASLAIAVVMAGFTMKHKAELGVFDESIYLLTLETISNRVFFAVVDVVHFIVTSFPDKYDYLFGYSYWTNLTAALPGADVGFGGWLNIEAFGMGGGATVPVVAELFVNFGEAGAYCGMLLTGLIVQSVYIHLLRRAASNKTIDTLLGITFLGMGLVTLAVNSVFGYLLYTFAPIWACLVGLRVLRGLVQRKVMIAAEARLS